MMIGSSAAQMSSVMSVAGVAQEGVVSGETKGYVEELLKIAWALGEDDRQSKQEMLNMVSQMINQQFKVLMDIAKNMGVTKEEREASKQRLKELKKKRDELERLKKEDLKDEAWEDFLKFLEQMVDPADRELLESQRVVKG